jgi:hypothetical protein
MPGPTGAPGPFLGLYYGWTDHDNGWGGDTNDALELLDSLIMAAVEQMGLNTPPGSPVNGTRYVVGSAPTGAWTGKANNIAAYINSAWKFYAPIYGFRVYDKNTNQYFGWLTSNAWVKEIDTGETPFTAQTVWTTGTHYTSIPPASYVSYNGSSYVCLTDHTAGTFATDLAAGKWGPVATAGTTPLGTLVNWATATAYTSNQPASFVQINGSTYSCAISHTSGTFATDLAAGKWIPIALAGAANTIYDFSIYVLGFVPGGQHLYRLSLTRAVEAPANLAGSVGKVGSNPTASYAVDLKKNGTTFATATVSTGGVVSFTTVGGVAVDFAIGDYIDVYAQATSDATLQDLNLTLLLTRL